MAVTIKDVAKEAGVSASTVSRVISDDRSISDKTKIKVRQVMEKLKYYPNMNARRLVSQRSQVIGLVLPNNSDHFYQNPFFPTVLRGINEVSTMSKYSLLLNTGNSDEERFDHVKQMVFGKQVDGLIFLYSRENDQIVDFLKDLNFPFVVIGSPSDLDINSVDNNNEQISRLATNYLLTVGARKIAFIGGDTHQAFVRLRYQGYETALNGFGLAINNDLIFNDVEFIRGSGFELANLLQEINNLDGMIIADQLVARGIKDAWRLSGLKQIPMITFKAYDSRESTDHSEVYINISAQELGQRAFSILLETIQENDSANEQRYYREIVPAILIN